eukprot:3402062-Pyramimonas_sp.AAC.1
MGPQGVACILAVAGKGGPRGSAPDLVILRQAKVFGEDSDNEHVDHEGHQQRDRALDAKVHVGLTHSHVGGAVDLAALYQCRVQEHVVRHHNRPHCTHRTVPPAVSAVSAHVTTVSCGGG